MAQEFQHTSQVMHHEAPPCPVCVGIKGKSNKDGRHGSKGIPTRTKTVSAGIVLGSSVSHLIALSKDARSVMSYTTKIPAAFLQALVVPQTIHMC